jgi:hypothetical protein
VNPTNFLTELKRRNVYRAAVAYGVVAWFLTQLTTQVFPFFEIPNSAERFVVIALAVGFPIANGGSCSRSKRDLQFHRAAQMLQAATFTCRRCDRAA